MFRSASVRLAAGTLALALPLAAAAGCGVEKKQSIKAEFAAAQTAFENSKAVSITFHMDDPQGNLAKSAKKDTKAALVDAVLKGSITFTESTVDGSSFGKIQGAGGASLKSMMQKVNMSLVVRDDKAVVAELRYVAGNLYARVDLNEVNRLVKLNGGQDINAKIDQALSSMPPQFAQVIQQARAGKWLELPVSKYLDQLQQLAKSANPALGALGNGNKTGDFRALGKKLFAAVKPYVKITDANDSSSNRVLDVNVQVRPAVKALLAVLSADKSLPFGSVLGSVTPAKIDENLADGTAHGTITLHNSHLTQVALDIESLRTLSTSPGKESMAGVRALLDVNDSASPVAAPSGAVDLGTLLDQFLGAAMGGMAGAGANGSYTG